jgi:hypothetical protein
LVHRVAQAVTVDCDFKQAGDSLCLALARGSADCAMLDAHPEAALLLARDDVLCERALKAILPRKNAVSYETQNAASEGDLLMSLIYTCPLNRANPLDHLTQLQNHADRVAASAEMWMPLNYPETLM